MLTARSVNYFTTNVKQFIVTAHAQSMPICVPNVDYKVEMRRWDTVEDLSFFGSMSRTKVTSPPESFYVERRSAILRVCTSAPGRKRGIVNSRTISENGLSCLHTMLSCVLSCGNSQNFL